MSQRNRCGYCLSAHAMIAGEMAGVSADEVVALVAALTFSNDMNHLAGTPLDFPPAPDLPVEG